MVWPLKSVELSLLDFDQCVTHLSEALAELQKMSVSADFGDPSEVAQYKANIAFLKRYYETLEGLVCGHQ